MSFKPATKEVGYVKGSMFGPKGTGKTTLMAMLLIYLSKKYHNSAPVAWLASEKGVDFVVDIFAAEGVPLLLNRSRSFLDLRSAAQDAIKEGACAVGVDSVSHFWQDLFTSGMQAKGPRLQKIGRIKEEWAPFAQQFQDSPIHFLVTGRMGFIWDEVEIENTKGELEREIAKSGTRIKAEGDFGHEPDLEIETAQMEDPDFIRFEKVRGKPRKTFKSQMLHVATVKKCREWALNGQAFTWKDLPGYKTGYFEKVAGCFQPYFDRINIGGANAVVESERPRTASLFEGNSDQSVARDRICRTALLEETAALLDQCFPGGEKRSKQDAMFRNLTLEMLNGYMSWSRMEEEVPTIQLERNVKILRNMRARLVADDRVTDHQSLAGLIKLSTDDVDQPGHGVTLLELMTAKSVAIAKAKGPQPIVPQLDRWPEREVIA